MLETLLTGIELAIAYAIPIVVWGVMYRLGRQLDLSLDAVVAVGGVSFAVALSHTGSFLFASLVGLGASVVLVATRFLFVHFGRVPFEIGSLLVAWAAFRLLELRFSDSYSLPFGVGRAHTALVNAGVPEIVPTILALVAVMAVLEIGMRTRLGLMFRALGENPELPVGLPSWKVFGIWAIVSATLIGIGGVLQADRQGSVACGFHLSRLVDAFVVAELTAQFSRRARGWAERGDGRLRVVLLKMVAVPVTIQLLLGAIVLGTLSYGLLNYLSPGLPSLAEAVIVLVLLTQFTHFQRLWKKNGIPQSSVADRGLILERVTKSYRTDLRAIDVLTGVTARLNKGLWVLYAGNAEGKSTLMKIIAGTLSPDGGAATFDGKLPGTRCRLINQDPMKSVAPTLTVRENLTLAQQRMQRSGSIFGLHQIDDETASRYLSRVSHTGDLVRGLDRSVAHFSGGQQQLLAVTAAVIDGSAILADEPTKMLDKEHKKLVEEELVRLSKDRLVLMATHDPRPDLAPPERHLHLHQGRVHLGIFENHEEGPDGTGSTRNEACSA